MEIYLIRHTKPDIPAGTFYGHADIELAGSYPQDFEATMAKLPERFDAVFSSPLKRCFTLARELEASFFKSDDRIKEMNLGDWEMKTHEEVAKAEFDYWFSNFVHLAPPAGESFEDLHFRVVDFFKELSKADYGTVAVVTHGGVVRSIVNHLLNIPLEKSFSYEIDHGSVTLVDLYGDKPKVKYINR